MDGAAATAGHPAAADADEADRRPPARRYRSRDFCRQLLHEPSSRSKLCSTSAVLAQRGQGARPGYRADPAFRDCDARDCAPGGRCRVGPLQHDAQPRRGDRHRRDRDLLHQARAVSLLHHQPACVAARTRDPQPARRAATIFHVARVPRPAGALHRAIIAVGQTIRAEATIMGYADSFALLGVVLSVAALLVAMLKKGAASGGGAH